MLDRKPLLENGSFRDSSGFVFYYNEKPHRAISSVYQDTYELFINSDLFSELLNKKYIIPHKEIPKDEEDLLRLEFNKSDIYKIISPEKIPFISYPYEWSFSQLKVAAILTLKIQELALKYNMTLKDASAYNVQFIGSNPVFIDTLSFEQYEEGKPWIAYRQFCQHFLAPLALMKYKSIELQRLNYLYLDGIPLSLASKLLPSASKFNSLLAVHIHFHAKFENKYSDQSKFKFDSVLKLSRKKLVGIIQHLLSGIEGLELKIDKSNWVNYYEENAYSDKAIESKKSIVREWISRINPDNTWDIGCNTGVFSEISGFNSGYTIAFDSDALSVERLYTKLKGQNCNNILPLVMDITNPSSSIGWANSERKTLLQREQPDLILALALIHHLSISNTIPFSKIAEYFSNCAEWLIIEFVPKSDPQSQKLLVTRKDVFHEYDLKFFKNEFSRHYEIQESHKIEGTERELFLMKKINK